VIGHFSRPSSCRGSKSHNRTTAQSLGYDDVRATTVVEATDVLKTVLADGGPTLIEVTLDRALKPM
jgi:thiamine pyrophosphate-dependent acetolactate synthase large subunit-like protein